MAQAEVLEVKWILGPLCVIAFTLFVLNTFVLDNPGAAVAWLWFAVIMADRWNDATKRKED
jgi:hypothetical protein